MINQFWYSCSKLINQLLLEIFWQIQGYHRAEICKSLGILLGLKLLTLGWDKEWDSDFTLIEIYTEVAYQSRLMAWTNNQVRAWTKTDNQIGSKTDTGNYTDTHFFLMNCSWELKCNWDQYWDWDWASNRFIARLGLGAGTQTNNCTKT